MMNYQQCWRQEYLAHPQTWRDSRGPTCESSCSKRSTLTLDNSKMYLSPISKCICLKLQNYDRATAPEAQHLPWTISLNCQFCNLHIVLECMPSMLFPVLQRFYSLIYKYLWHCSRVRNSRDGSGFRLRISWGFSICWWAMLIEHL